MNVGLWTVMSGKILEFSYHGNRCHGDQNTFSEFNNGHFGIEVAYGWLQEDGKRYPKISVTMETKMLPQQPKHVQHVASCIFFLAFFGIGFEYELQEEWED